ncbi:hypothetical protein ACGF5O_15010 [Streptomyces sp. NPDC048291]
MGIKAVGAFGPLMQFTCGTEFAAPRFTSALFENTRDWMTVG